MAVWRRSWAVLGFLAAMSVRQACTDPFRTYLLVRLGTLAAGSIAGAALLRTLQPTLAPGAESRFYLPVLAAVLALAGLGLLAVRLLAHRWLNVGRLRELITPCVLSQASGAILRRSLPRTYLVTFVILLFGSWASSATELAPWFQGLGWSELATLAAGASLLGWWNLGPDCEVAAGRLLWPRPQRPLRFFPHRYHPVGEQGRRVTTDLLDLPRSSSLLPPSADSGSTPREAVRRRLAGYTLSELTARLASVAPADELPELVRARLAALEGSSVLELARRAADPRDSFSVDELAVRGAALTPRDLGVGGAHSGQWPDRRASVP